MWSAFSNRAKQTPLWIWAAACVAAGVMAFSYSARTSRAEAPATQPQMSPAEDGKLQSVRQLLYALGDKSLDVYLTPDGLASGKPSLSGVKWSGVEEMLDGDEYIKFARDRNSHWDVNPKSIVAISVVDSRAK